MLLTKGAAALAEVKAPLRNNFDLVYTVIAQVGTPAVAVRLIIDTGSSDVWVKGTSVSAPFGTQFGFGRVYDRWKSATADTSLTEQVTILYGQGQVVGVEVRDRVCLERLCIANQSFVFAEQVVGIPDQWMFDGILGLGFPLLALDRSGDTFLQSLNETFHHLAVGFSLGGEGAPSSGFLAIGELQELQGEAASGGLGEGVTLRLYGINRKAMFWLVQTSVAVVASGQEALPGATAQVLVAGPETALAILDSGTSLIAAPGAAYEALVRALVAGPLQDKCTTTLAGAMGLLMCLCDVELNPITFTLTGLGGRQLQVTLASKDLMQLVGIGANGVTVCRISVMPAPAGMPVWILGDAFLRHVYAVHDVPGKKVQLFPQLGSHAAAILEPELPTAAGAAASWAAGATALACAVVLMAPVVLFAFACRRRKPLADAFYMRL